MIDTVKTFTALIEEFVEITLRHHPVQATAAGIHDYDHKLPNDTPDGFRERSSWLRDLEQRLVASVPWEELPHEQRVDYALLRSRISAMRADIEEIKSQAKNPSIYPETAQKGIHLLTRAFAPLEERKEAILARMMAVPDYLDAARANLQQVPELFVSTAHEVCTKGPAFVDGVVHDLLAVFPGEAERIEHAGGRARVGFLQFQDFLEHDLRKRVGGTFAIGERWMNFKLERQHLLNMNCTALEAFGRQHIDSARSALEAQAKTMDANRSWRELVEDAKKRHPEAAKLRDAYVAEVQRAKRFVEEKKIAPIPDGTLEIVDTPVFDRVTLPYAAYEPPAPFDEEAIGWFYVTPIDQNRSAEEQEEQLRGHNYASLSLTTVHEAWPGHHLQLLHASAAGSRLRRLSDSDVFAEGWALYCEELMHEQGYFLDPASRLYQLRDLLWRACRVVIDVGLQTGRMSIEDAAKMLVDEAMLEPVNAAMEVKRYTMEPTQPMSYLVGKQEIIDIRDEVKLRTGGRFNLLEFHESLLACGTLPPQLVRMELAERMPG